MTKIYRVDSTVVHLADPGCEFLKGYGANHLDRPRNAFVDIKGKVVATFNQVQIEDDQFLLAVEKEIYPTMMDHLKKYLMISKAAFEDTDYKAYFDLEGEWDLGEDEYTVPQRQGRLVLSKQDIESTVSDDEFTRFRLDHEIPRQGIDYHHEMLLNVSPDEYAAFDKGCFLGQEVLSRVHFKAKPPRKLVVKSRDECPPDFQEKMTSTVADPETGKIRGFVFVSNK